MVVPIELMIFLDVFDEVALHYLHVVDIIEQLKAWTIQFLS